MGRRRPFLSILPCSSLLLGCMSIQDDDWRFCLSRAAYPRLLDEMEANEPLRPDDPSSRGQAEAVLVFLGLALVLPVALDVACLPITATHDAILD